MVHLVWEPSGKMAANFMTESTKVSEIVSPHKLNALMFHIHLILLKIMIF